jgi:hypothetical protein
VATRSSLADQAASAMTALMTTAKDAAQLAVKAKLATLTLTIAYQTLGRHYYTSSEYRTELPDLFRQLDQLRDRLATLAKMLVGSVMVAVAVGAILIR